MDVHFSLPQKGFEMWIRPQKLEGNLSYKMAASGPLQTWQSSSHPTSSRMET
jgi:hypothetical protein